MTQRWRESPQGKSSQDRPAEAALATGALARRLGVAPTTLRTWERRYGIGPSRRVQGRHRRWSAEDVARMERMCRLTAQGVTPAEAARLAMAEETAEKETAEKETAEKETAEKETAEKETAAKETAEAEKEAAPAPQLRSPGGFRDLPLGQVWPESRGLARSAVRLDASAVQAQLHSAVDTYGVVVAWEQIIAPTLHAVGRKWASADESYVEVEHLLSWHVSTTLRTTATPPTDQRPPVLLACMPGEQHSLPIEALWAALAERGLPTRMFGAAVPVEALESAARRIGPCAVVLWSQSRDTADLTAVRTLLTLGWGVRGARSHPLALLAGPGWTSTPPEPGAGRLTGLASALALLESLFRTVTS
ncbi:MerR family transcriptional regulator [Streptomyces sp. B-S-A8]|uniref:MerR family transcriptional regulator n=1 Tax=Streptomyces solicavernae TaxID=3043614 RepID=A0ABT6RTY2_9ACTN|nr:MerR family transcriptional regulator [Streptomyces sp. B-S-A8]MDI3387780.1 MerR family transcriptional regulator [Streptomyces sp. B-S-A8]